MVAMNFIHVFLHHLCYPIVGLLSGVATMFQKAAELEVCEGFCCLATYT
jgi:hypothetical protein